MDVLSQRDSAFDLDHRICSCPDFVCCVLCNCYDDALKMALNEKRRLALESKGFAALYDDHEDDWINLANDARSLIRPQIASGNPTVDDIKLILKPLVEL